MPSDLGLYPEPFEALWWDCRPCIHPVEPAGIFALTGGRPGCLRLPSWVSVVVPFLISKPFQRCVALYLVIYWNSPFGLVARRPGLSLTPSASHFHHCQCSKPRVQREKKAGVHCYPPPRTTVPQLEQKIPPSPRSRYLDLASLPLAVLASRCDCEGPGDARRQRKGKRGELPSLSLSIRSPLSCFLSQNYRALLVLSASTPRGHLGVAACLHPSWRDWGDWGNMGRLLLLWRDFGIGSSPICVLAFHIPKYLFNPFLLGFIDAFRERSAGTSTPSDLEAGLKLVPLHLEMFCHEALVTRA